MPTPGILNVSEEEWRDAKAFFERQRSLPQNQRQAKMPRPQGSQTQHSFIEIPGNPPQIFAMANTKSFEEKQGYLGAGGFGKVKVVQNENGENFAVKVEGRGLRGEQDAEARIAKICGLYIGEAQRKLQTKFKGSDTKLYTVMQLVKGKDLEKHLLVSSKDVQLTQTQQLVAAFRACKAIDELHEKGIIHADIKSANLMADINGHAVVVSAIDYGLSMQLPAAGEQVVMDYRKGTDMFMAPELNSKDNAKVPFSCASDIYALGMTFRLDFKIPQEIWFHMLEPNPAQRPELRTVMLNIAIELNSQMRKNPALAKELAPILEEMGTILDKKPQQPSPFLQHLHHFVEAQNLNKQPGKFKVQNVDELLRLAVFHAKRGPNGDKAWLPEPHEMEQVKALIQKAQQNANPSSFMTNKHLKESVKEFNKVLNNQPKVDQESVRFKKPLDNQLSTYKNAIIHKKEAKGFFAKLSSNKTPKQVEPRSKKQRNI